MLQTENLTPLQNLAVVSRSPDITEAIVLSRIIGPSLGQLQSQQLGEEAMTRQTSLPLFLSQSLAMCEALQLGGWSSSPADRDYLYRESSLGTARADNDAMQLLPSRLFPVCDIENQPTSLRNQC